MQNIDILDPNLANTHPTLVPWVNGMRQAGYSPDQIRMYFRVQMEAQMQGASMQQQTQQHHPPTQQNAQQQQQQKMQMARNIVQAYTGRVFIEQVLAMPFDRIQGSHNEIVSRLKQSQQQAQPQQHQQDHPQGQQQQQQQQQQQREQQQTQQQHHDLCANNGSNGYPAAKSSPSMLFENENPIPEIDEE